MNRTPHYLLGAAACVTAFLSAAIHGGYFCVVRALPIHMVEGGVNFTSSMNAWRGIIAALALGILSAVFLILSCVASHRRVFISPRAIATCVFLIPAAYTGYCLVMLFQQ